MKPGKVTGWQVIIGLAWAIGGMYLAFYFAHTVLECSAWWTLPTMLLLAGSDLLAWIAALYLLDKWATTNGKE